MHTCVEYDLRITINLKTLFKLSFVTNMNKFASEFESSKKSIIRKKDREMLKYE